MQKKIGLLCLVSLFLIAACTDGSMPHFLDSIFPSKKTSGSSSGSPSVLSSMPTGKGLVFIGVVGRRSNPKETVQFALEDAARRVSIFQRVYGEYAIENNVGSGAFDYTYNTYTSLQYNKDGAIQYVDSLQFNADTDTVEMENVFIIRTTYPAALSVPVNYRPTYDKTGRPDWVDNLSLEIAGYEVGIGFSGRYASLADTYANSCNNAIFAIIRKINSTSQSSSMLYQNSTNLFGYKTTNDNITYSYGTLNGFYVLDAWFDSETKTVWTLAIARKD